MSSPIALPQGIKCVAFLGLGHFTETSLVTYQGKACVLKQYTGLERGSSEAFVQFITYLARFKSLQHPAITALLADGIDLWEQPYIISPMVYPYEHADKRPDGGLSEVAFDQPRTLEEAVWLKDIIIALEYAHKLGVFHGAIRPGHILCQKGGTHYQLTDFMLTPHTVSGRFWRNMGTPESDQYGLAATILNWLIGYPPMMNGKVDKTLIPQKYRFALEKALSDEPRARFASIGEFYAALYG